MIFKVRGTGIFPFDMLRVEKCWPYSQTDVYDIKGDRLYWRTITLETNSIVISPEKWEHYKWRIVDG